LLAPNEIGLSEAAWELLGGIEHERVRISHLPPVESMGSVRGRIFGGSLGKTSSESGGRRRPRLRQRSAWSDYLGGLRRCACR
jgi:hypothetical protein